MIRIVKYKSLFLLLLAVIASTLVLWLPFFLRISDVWGLNFSDGMMKVWANFDGPNYLTVARTWYDKALIARNFSVVQPLEYYPAHWPFYPFVIFLTDLLFSGPNAMLFSSLLGVVFFYFVFYRFLVKEGLTEKQALVMGTASLVLPARWLIIRGVGSPEAWFMGFILLSLMAYSDKKYWLAGLWGALAQLTKSPAILLFASYGIYEIWKVILTKKMVKENIRAMVGVSLIPLMAILVFGFYFLRTGDFWAYFHSGDNIHLIWPPFSTFGKSGTWVGDFWLEEFIWMWLIYGVGIMKLAKRGKKLLVIFGGAFFTATLFVAHRDIARYILPIMPLALLGWNEMVQKREFKVVLLVLVVPTFLFAWNFMLNNTAPIADWSPYL